MNHSESFLSDEEVALLKSTALAGFREDQQATFIRICQRSRLDPFTRQIYATRRMSHGQVTLVTVTGIQGLAAIAERTGQYDGCQIYWSGPDGVWREEWLSEEFPAAAKAIVYHKGHTYPEVGIARWESYVGRQYNSATKRWDVSDFWNKMPDLMLAKVAKALALRGAFPDHLSGLYATEELDQNIGSDELDDERKISENRKKEAELLAKSGAKVVSKPVARPTPAEEAEEAFPEDKPTPPPISGPTTKPPQPPLPEPPTAPAEPDDLDMESPEPTPPEPSADSTPGGAPVEKPWAEHQLLGLKTPRFYRRTVGDLKPAELAAIESQWIPKVRAIWPDVNKLQRDDVLAIERAIAHYKMERPWP